MDDTMAQARAPCGISFRHVHMSRNPSSSFDKTWEQLGTSWNQMGRHGGAGPSTSDGVAKIASPARGSAAGICAWRDCQTLAYGPPAFQDR